MKIDTTKFGPWAVVTGASSGIGKEFARQLAANGLNLVLVARRHALLEQIGQNLAAEYGIAYRAVGLDLSTDDFMPQIESATADLDVGLVVSNAGAGSPGAFLEHEHDDLQQIVRLNVHSHLALTHYFGQRLAGRGRGGLLLVAAMGASQGIPYMANDAATKAYVVSLGHGLHVEFAKLGVNVTVVLPGPTETPVLDAFGLEMDKLPMKPMPVEQCVNEGLAALNANRPAHLTGRMNRILQAVVPASISRRMMGDMLSSGAKNRPQPVHPGTTV
jgi:hypothetical protein